MPDRAYPPDLSDAEWALFFHLVLDGSPAEAAMPRYGGGDLLRYSVWLCIADAALALPAIAMRSQGRDVRAWTRPDCPRAAEPLATEWDSQAPARCIARAHSREGGAHVPALGGRHRLADGMSDQPGRFQARVRRRQDDIRAQAPPAHGRTKPDPSWPTFTRPAATLRWEHGRWSRQRRLQSALPRTCLSR